MTERSADDNVDVKVSLKHHLASTYPILRRLDQQFALEGKFADYQNGLSRVSGLNKNALSTLGDQERRLREMQASLRSSLSTQAESEAGRNSTTDQCNDPPGEVGAKTQEDATANYARKFTADPCPRTLVIRDTALKHAGGPTNAAVGLDAEPKERWHPTTVPDAPSNFHATEVRQDSFTVVWDAVKSDANQVDYEIRYRYFANGTEKQVLQRCSRWLLKNPLPNGHFVVPNLMPDTEYRDIALRCRNAVGWSEFCDPVKSLSTAPRDEDYESRRSKFIYRIGYIEDAIKRLEAERQHIPTEQVLLARKMTQTQDERMLALNKEIERIASHAEDELLSSDLLHGASQTFTKRTLKRKIEQELVICRENIAMWRAEIIDLDKESAELAAEIEDKRTQLGERKAALLQFDKRHTIVSGLKYAVSKEAREMKQYYISLWKTRVADRLDIQKTLRSVARSCRRRIVAGAWSRLCSLIDRQKAGRTEVAGRPADGIGGKLLNTAEQCLEENLADATNLIEFMSTIQEGQGVEEETGEACPTHLLCKEDRDALRTGSFLLDAGHCHSSLKSFRRVLSKMEAPSYFSGLSSADAAYLYAEVNGKIGHAHLKMGSYDLAIQYFGRQLSLADEEDLDLPRTSALLGLGICYHAKHDHRYAKSFFERALELCLVRGDKEQEAVTYEHLAKCCECLNRPEDAKAWLSKLQSMDETSWERQSGGTAISRQGVNKALEELDTLRDRLINTSAKESRLVRLEVASAHCVKLQRATRDKKQALGDAKERLSSSIKLSEELRGLIGQIEYELEEAKHTKRNMVSRLLHGQAQEIKAQELRIRLEAELKLCHDKQEDGLSEISQTRLLIRNVQDDIHLLDEAMEVECGPLMQHILQGRKYRCAALNSSNIACDDVTGKGKSGGVPSAAVSEGNSCYVHNLATGKLEHVFISDEDGSTATISCLFFYGHRVFAGTMDSLVVGWETSTSKQLFVARGHEASVTCLHADDSKIVSGSADQSIIVWNSDGEMIRRVNGHARGVHCIQCGPSWCVSASYGTVFVWNVRTDAETDKVKAVDCKRRFVLPEDRNVTSLHYGELEVITGDNLGRLSVWWVELGELQLSFGVHDGPISSLQVDATKAVSAGLDMTVAISDIIRGEVLQRLRGHAAPILAVAFDKRQILSLASDGVRFWEWGRPARCARRRKATKPIRTEGS